MPFLNSPTTLEASPPPSNIHSPPPPSQDVSPITSNQSSPDLNRLYSNAVQTNSFNEIWKQITVHPSVSNRRDDEDGGAVENAENSHHQLLAQMLRPDRICVQEALSQTKQSTLTRLVSKYFDHSEETCHLCILLCRSLNSARSMYAPLFELLDRVPLDSDYVTQSECDRTYNVFVEFDKHDNPFPSPDSHNVAEMHRCSSQLYQQLDRRLRKSRSRMSLVQKATLASGFCVLVTAVGMVVAAAVVTTHALVAVVAAPFCTTYLCGPKVINKKELALDAAALGAFVLNSDLITIDCLVKSLYDLVEADKNLIRIGLGSDRDRHAMQLVLKQLHGNREKLLHKLKALEEHICFYFNNVNSARSLLFREISNHQTGST